ncbi:signal peptidase II [Lachnoclostridium sp. An131]|jgi:signal peptidase II|uniref:signal peptidase II n=1 Tax=Lachnoclostridium sp. An131 TaxID=1965555 RepID=UPI000B386941|nr:signal peptidase II [Lachnoclostridium sp. An131]OUQ27074.1 signal peptidase II [Lachnoclostridium sp. An131]
MTRQKYNLIGILAAIVLIALDQWTKHLAVLRLKGQSPIVLWDGVFELHYLENRGAAFGILQGQKAVFLVCTLLILILIVFFYNRLPAGKRFFMMRLVAVFLAAGAVGNLIDRMRYSYVVDFLYFKLIDFPVFNVADCYVTVGAVLLAVLILFVYKEEELGFLSLKRQGGKKDA